jgi:hypothetical protein
MMANDLKIWRVESCSNKYLSVYSPQKKLSYFDTNFIGKPMLADWVLPEIELRSKSKKAADFVSWSVDGSFMVSAKAKLVLEPVLNEYVEFLRFHDIKGKPYYAVNVLQVEPNLLYADKSEILYGYDEPKNILILKSAVFVNPLPTKLPPIFKIEFNGRIQSEIFVTKPFADILIEHQLTGIELADPSQYDLPYVLENKSQNVVQGVIGCK